jgi:hypothetical protein
MPFHSVIETAARIIATPKTFDTDNILDDLLIYDKKKWYRYDTATSIYMADVITMFLDKYAFISSDIELTKDTEKIYTRIPGAVIKGLINTYSPYSSLKEIHGIVFSNVAVFVLVTPFAFRLIMYVDPKFIDLYESIPTPAAIIEFLLTSRINFDELSEYSHIDKHL